MKKTTKIVVVTGAESTGKSSLCKWLAEYYNVPFVPEFARTYIEQLNRAYNFSDVEKIARYQETTLRELKSQGHPLVFSDTWLIITKIWFEEVYNSKPAWIEDAITTTPIDLFLVCDTDLPWIPDRVRENGGQKRLYLQNRYVEIISENKFPYYIIRGKNKTRFQNAVSALIRAGIVKPNE